MSFRFSILRNFTKEINFSVKRADVPLGVKELSFALFA